MNTATTPTTTPTQPSEQPQAPDTRTQAQIFSSEYARATARGLLDSISRNGMTAAKIAWMMLSVSTPHQGSYLLGRAQLVFPTHWNGTPFITSWLETLSMIAGCVMVPVAADLLILIQIRILSARGAAKSSKLVAFAILCVAVAFSGTINVMAPAPKVIRFVFGFAVALIVMAEAAKATFKPDLKAIDAMERQTVADVTPEPEPEPQTTPAGPTGRELDKQRKAAVDKARVLAASAPMMTAAVLRQMTGVSQKTASKLLMEARGPVEAVVEV